MCDLEDPKTNSAKLLLGAKFLDDNVYDGKPAACRGVLVTGNIEYLGFFIPSMRASEP